MGASCPCLLLFGVFAHYRNKILENDVVAIG